MTACPGRSWYGYNENHANCETPCTAANCPNYTTNYSRAELTLNPKSGRKLFELVRSLQLIPFPMPAKTCYWTQIRTKAPVGSCMAKKPYAITFVTTAATTPSNVYLNPLPVSGVDTLDVLKATAFIISAFSGGLNQCYDNNISLFP